MCGRRCGEGGLLLQDLAMSQVIDYLERFNRKERFILLSHVLDQEDQKAFRLNRRFREDLGGKIQTPIPVDAFVAMDFHLDWLQMALYLADSTGEEDFMSCTIPNPDDILVKGNQEDIDLIVAFRDKHTNDTRLVLVEAKADTGWTNKQLMSKAKRLSLIFSKQSCGTELVKPHFVLMSPHEPRGIDIDTWPNWMKGKTNALLWVELPLRDGLLKVTRCDKGKHPAKDGGHLLVSEIAGGKWKRSCDCGRSQ